MTDELEPVEQQPVAEGEPLPLPVPQEETMTDEERVAAMRDLVAAENAAAPSAAEVARLNGALDRWSPDARPADDVVDPDSV